MKAYKGFNKDMTCKGFQYEEGKTYTTDEAKLCESGFHACENPLDCFGYYAPTESVYHEVELEDVSDEKGKDTKRCGKKIKIGAALDVAGLVKAHFEYVKAHTTNEQQGADNANLTAQDNASLAAQDGSSLAAQNRSSLAAQDRSSLAAQNRSSLAARNWSSLAARNWSSLAAQDGSSLAAQDWSSLAARNWSSLAAQDWSSLAARNWSSLAAQDRSSLAAGENSVLAAFNSKAKAGLGSVIAIANREILDDEWKITDFAAGVVDGVKIKPDTWYRVENGGFVEVESE